MTPYEIVQLLLDHLPDSTHDDKSWDWCWNELSDDAQKQIKTTRRAAREFISSQSITLGKIDDKEHEK